VKKHLVVMKNLKPLTYFLELLLRNTKKKYCYIRFGVTLIALQPLTTSGLDYPVFMAVKDNRLIRQKDSLLAMIK